MKVPLKMHQMPILECIFVPLCTFLVFPLHVLEIMQLCISNATALLEVPCCEREIYLILGKGLQVFTLEIKNFPIPCFYLII